MIGETTICKGCSAVKDLRGKKFGRLVPLYPLYPEGRDRKWMCKCDCGNYHIAMSHHIQCESNVSCGCYHIERSKKMIGPDNPRWNPNITDEQRRNGRSNDVKYLEWAKLIKKRDAYKCVICDVSISNEMASHHLDAWRDYPEKRYALGNGVCLCKYCHIKFHSAYGSGCNTREQFESYISSVKE